ncbi:hypothetical protein IMCC3317_07190 [Kordia antarctica]|uniref:Natural product n=1 Tax=Kordia antarctica TaxID=1218801 RepID=A0A7L4ZFC1_9FLAO|nr:class I lanthipeptide [Kordia antarctica]QHI35373.1 hypothetical protein IMCC3317_07190 [Kordia antarctica]
MKKISTDRQLRLNKENVSKLNTLKIHSILGGNIPDLTKGLTCDLGSCTTSRTTVDLNGGKSYDTLC